MMIIAHRANLHGPDKSRENKPFAIAECLRFGYHVEVDLWVENETCWFGHDSPETRVQKIDVKHAPVEMIFHCKNVEALDFCQTYSVEHYFFHDKDDVVLTSKGFFWTYPRKQKLFSQSIPVVFDRNCNIWTKEELQVCAGICTDDAYYFSSLM